MLALPSLLLLYLALATYKIHLPGLYYDEMLFVGPAAGERPYLRVWGLPLLTFPYIGALKAWLYTPIFKLVEPSAVSIRLPAILISCGTLTFGYLLLRRILTPRWAIVFTLACAYHPGFVLLTRVDLGPIALMLFFKALCLYLLFRWLETPRFLSWSLSVVVVTCALGFFDKFNFIWFVVAVVFSTLAVYGREIFQKGAKRIGEEAATGCRCARRTRIGHTVDHLSAASEAKHPGVLRPSFPDLAALLICN